MGIEVSPGRNARRPPEDNGVGSALGKARDALLLFLPKPIQEAVSKGLIRTLVLLVFVVVVLPVLIAYLAAFWVTQLGRLHNSYAVALRKEILTTVNEGFTVEEVANEVTSQNNRKLDYLQVIDANLSSSGLREWVLRMALQDNQRVNIDVQDVKITAKGQCSLRESAIDAVLVDFEGVPVKTLRDNAQSEFRINQAVWKEVIQSAPGDNSPKKLTFRLAPAVVSADCGELEVHVSGAVMVFKNIDSAPAAAQEGAK